MSEHLEKLQQQEKKAAILSSVFLGVAMLTMAIWGWTPLKETVPALPVLTVFVSFVFLAIVGAVFRIYRGIQIRALKAKISDTE